ncbi:MAG TPA: hypothetical protein PLU78_09375, partial [Chitinophagales bacterium]|nr:hypothetical protein [Chitinophagales bacterium]
GYLFRAPQQYDSAVLQKIANIKPALDIAHLSDFLLQLPELSAAETEEKIKSYTAEHNIKTGEMMKFLRVSLVGELSGPAIPDLIVLLGIRETAARINHCFSQL